MSLVYGLKLTCDLYFYLTLIGELGWLSSLPAWFNLLPILLGIGAGFGYFLREKGNAMRYLPLAVGLALLPLHPGKLAIFLSLPQWVYAVFYIRGNKHATDHYYAFQRFRIGMIPLAIMFLFMLMVSIENITTTIPPLFMHLALSITLLRMLRHDDRIIRQKKFRVMNVLSLLGMGAVGVLLSTDVVLRVLKWLGKMFYLYVIRVFLSLLAMIVQGVCWVLEKMFSWFDTGTGAMPQLEGATQTAVGEEGFQFPQTAEEVMANPLLRNIVYGVGIAAAVVVAVLLIKLLSKQQTRDTKADQEEERESLDDTQNGGSILDRLRRRSDPVSAVRAVYARFLAGADRAGVPLNGRQNSLQIENLSESAFESDGLSELREVYIRARYDGDATKADVAAAKEAFGKIRKRKAGKE